MSVTPLRPGDSVEDMCRACKIERDHTVFAAGDETRPPRVRCNFCGSEHNYRSSRRRIDEKALTTLRQVEGRGEEIQGILEEYHELAELVRHVLREELGFSPTDMTKRFEGGELVFRPGTPGTQEKTFPLETFLAKIVSVRNRMRVLEQQINGSEELSDLSKLRFQAYITACYGTLTSFNFLFRNEEDRFVGQKGGKAEAADD